jgi:crossover junction endodeoxyribonuclease RuvC
MRPVIDIGIDPGATGAIAVYCDGKLAAVYDIPTLRVKVGRTLKTRVDGAALYRLAMTLAMLNPRRAVIEQVGGIPGQSAPASFAFGAGVGLIHMALIAAGIPFSEVPPSRWKRDLGVPADKGATRQIAMRTFPAHAEQFSRVKDDGRAEASLLAKWGAESSRV